MKKFLLTFLILCLLPIFSITLSGCDEDTTSSTKTIMTLSLNPKIEFIVDNNGVVLTASAINNEGNFILINDNFVGNDYKDCSLKFINLCQKYGFLEKGESLQKIDVSISGENAKQKFDAIEDVFEDFLDENDYSISVDYSALDFNYIKTSTLKAYKNISSVNDLSGEKLIDMLYKSRIETQNLYTQELKEFYYQDRAKEILKAELTAIKSYVNEKNVPALNRIISDAENSLNNAIGQIDETSNAFKNDYLTVNGNYRNKMNEYIKNKRALLEINLGSNNEGMENLKEIYDNSKTEIEDAYATLEGFLSVPMNSLMSIKENLLNGVSALYKDAEKIVNDASKKAGESYLEIFSSYGLITDNNYWANLAPKTNN